MNRRKLLKKIMGGSKNIRFAENLLIFRMSKAKQNHIKCDSF